MVSQPSLDPGTLAALREFRQRLGTRYGERFRGLILFGSRARGDHRDDSDADVAVFIDPIADPIGAQMDMVEDAYLVFLDRGLLIQPWVFRGTPAQPDRTRVSHLLDAVIAEGVPV